MMDIFFRSIRYQQETEISFGLKDGPNHVDLDTFKVGDRFTLSWPITEKQAGAIQGMGMRPQPYHVGFDFEKYWRIYIELVVVERRHSSSFWPERDRMNLRYGGLQIFLQAADWFNEDILLWMTEGNVPGWADDSSEKSAVDSGAVPG